MKKLIWIGVAGALGALARTGLSELIPSETGFPLATFIVNILGTFLLCFLVKNAVWRLKTDPGLHTAITTGFLGSFTTFSALSMETILRIEEGQLFMAILYIVLSIVGGLNAGLLGFHLGRKKVRE